MTPSFKIVYRTTTDALYELSIPNAFDFIQSSTDDVNRINTAARSILTANALNTTSGDLDEIVSITFYDNNVSTYEVNPQ